MARPSAAGNPRITVAHDFRFYKTRTASRTRGRAMRFVPHFNHPPHSINATYRRSLLFLNDLLTNDLLTFCIIL